MPEIHVQVRIAERFPSRKELASRRALEAALCEIGEVTDAGAGGGVMDVWFRVDAADVAVPRVDEILARLDLADRTTVTVKPPSVSVEIEAADGDEEPAEGEDTVAAYELDGEALAGAIEDNHAGQILSFGVLPGYVALHVAVEDVSVAVAQISKLTEELGLADRTKIRGRP
jgi:hypothetical protein